MFARLGRFLNLRQAPVDPPPTAPTVFDLVQRSDRFLLQEVRYGCGGRTEAEIEQFGRDIVEGEIRVLGTDEEQGASEQLWINCLRLGLLDQLLALFERKLLPFSPDIERFARYCREQYAVCTTRGEELRRRHADREIFVLGCIVWGEEYISNFLRYNLRSMLSEGNLPDVERQGTVVFNIVTDGNGRKLIEESPLFPQLTAVAEVQFVVIPAEVMVLLKAGHLVRNFYILYGMLDHCSIYLAQAAHAHLYMIPVDAVVARGSLVNMANWRRYGFECCGGGNIVAETETFLPALDALFGDKGVISISTSDLASLAVKHAHHYFRSQILAAENSDFGKHPRELFWPVEGGVEIHSVFIHPLFTSASALQRYVRRHYANIDYGMIPRMFNCSQTIKVIDDASEAYVNNFTAAGRLYETTGHPFRASDFLLSHDKYSYAVQCDLFKRAQRLPCRLDGWTAYRSVEEDVREMDLLLRQSKALSGDKS